MLKKLRNLALIFACMSLIFAGVSCSSSDDDDSSEPTKTEQGSGPDNTGGGEGDSVETVYTIWYNGAQIEEAGTVKESELEELAAEFGLVDADYNIDGTKIVLTDSGMVKVEQVMAGGGAGGEGGEGPVYTLNFIADAGGTTLTDSCYSVTGGTFSATARLDKDNNIVRETDGMFTFPLQGGGETFVCSGDFKAGDTVSIIGYIKSGDVAKSGTIKINSKLPDSDVDNKGFPNITEGGFNYVNGNPAALTWVLTADTKELNIKRNSASTGSGTNVFVVSVMVTRP